MSSAWSKSKRKAFESAYYEFLNNCYINSKDGGVMCLGDGIYPAQTRLCTAVFDGLERDVHDFKVLKSRQLGVSTITRALHTFWIGIHEGLPSATVFDTDSNKKKARREIENIIDNLPPAIKFPRIRRRSREALVLENDAELQFFAAGTKATKTSGTLGRSSGIAMASCSEMCSWDSPEGVEAFINSLSEVNPNRLYIWESTARGYEGVWYDIWNNALADPEHQSCIFLGWYLKTSQQIEKSDPDFDRYGIQPPTEAEERLIKEVRDRYDWKITPEQLAWVRRKIDPKANTDENEPLDYSANALRLQEQPWTAEQAFQMTGSKFFEPDILNEQAQKYATDKYKSYYYGYGFEFPETRAYPSTSFRETQLKVWEAPVEDSVYIVASDPAFGHSERSDRSAIQVLRCYADGIDQVAEYAWPLINTRQFAWVIASILGWYAGERSEVYNIIEINGPGEAVWNELQTLKQQVTYNRSSAANHDDTFRNIFKNVRNYIYNRSDSMSAGHNYHFKTNVQLKVSIMERLRDFTANYMLRLRSLNTLEEMRRIAREGDHIGGEGSAKDDRVMSLALGARCWDERIRRKLISEHRTRESEDAKRRMSFVDQYQLFNKNQLSTFLSSQSRARVLRMAAARRNDWRNK
jgi:hypothetical protein